MYTIKIAMLIISMLIDVKFQKITRKADKERRYLIKEQFL